MNHPLPSRPPTFLPHPATPARAPESEAQGDQNGSNVAAAEGPNGLPAVECRRKVLIVADDSGEITDALRLANPELEPVPVATAFDALARLGEADDVRAIVAPAAALERRADTAVPALRQGLDAGDRDDARLILYGDASEEPLARKLLALGGDDFIVTPPDPEGLRLALDPPVPVEAVDRAFVATAGLPELTADALLAALTGHPGDSVSAAVAHIAERLDPGLTLALSDADTGDLSVPLRDNDARRLCLLLTQDIDPAELDVLNHGLLELAAQLAKLAELDDRHTRLQRLALTDDLTGCANKRYYRHFLDRILAKARRERFPVTLLLFDIDNFKHYNDRHGHPVGDEILKETALLIKRCVRDHDFVARIGGDEFAVVFWEKADESAEEPAADDDIEGLDRQDLRRSGRFPKGPLQIAARFRRLINSPEFAALGPSGVGRLSISGGMAVFPYDASTAEDLIAAADNALVSNAKRCGKNSIAIVGEEA